jgi:NTE family protein
MGAMRVGLVLGGGGVTGLAYHAGALAALERTTGWDPRLSEIVVGTSAGSVVGALLRRRIAAGDLAAIAVGDEPRSSPPAITRALRDRPEFPPVRLRSLVARPPRLPGPALIGAWLRRPWRIDPVSALASVVPDGRLDLADHTTALDEVLGSPWTDEDLWVCVVRRRDLRRVVLGRDATARLADAVTASCAIPGYFRPVEIDGETYLDGGVRSPTNADVLRRADLDLAIVVSPMSGRGLGRLGGPATMVRRHARARLDGERRRLQAAGIPTVVLEPGPAVIDVLGPDFMSDARTGDIVAATAADTAEHLRSPVVEALVAGLTAAARRDGPPPGPRRRHRRPLSRRPRRPAR